MNTHDLKNFDQNDAQILCDRLSLHAANLRGMVHTSEGQLVSPPTLSGGAIERNPHAGNALRTELELRLNGAAPAFEFSTMRPASGFPGTSAAGSSSHGAGFKKLGASSAKLTTTEKILASRGVSSLAELTEKMSKLSHEEKMQSARKLDAAR